MGVQARVKLHRKALRGLRRAEPFSLSWAPPELPWSAQVGSIAAQYRIRPRSVRRNLIDALTGSRSIVSLIHAYRAATKSSDPVHFHEVVRWAMDRK